MLRRALIVSVLLVLGPLAGTASATIVFSAPVSSNTYINNVLASWSVSTAPQAGSVQMVWTYVSGPYTVSQPVTLTLANVTTSTTSGSFSFNPAAVTTDAAHFSAASGALPDGKWNVYMRYVQNSNSVTLQSSTVTNVTISTATAPPTLTSPAASTSANTLPVTFTLPDAPSLSTPVTLSLTNTTTSAVSVLTLASRSQSQTFTLDPSDLAANTAAVTSVSGPTALSDGTYDVSLSYADTNGHPVATTTNDSWVLDRTTQAPTLLAPASGGASGRPIAVRYSLPEAALSGSVSLVFTGPETVTLTLGDTSAGTHTLSLNPTGLASSADVTAVSPTGATLTSGTYNVTVSYQDALGNPTASAASSGVALNLSTAPPVITTPTTGATASTDLPVSFTLPSPVLANSTTVSLSGPAGLQLSVPNASSGTNTVSVPVCSLPAGSYTLTVTYSDQAGDPAASTTTNGIQVTSCASGSGSSTTSGSGTSTPAGSTPAGPGPGGSGPARSAAAPTAGRPHIRWRVSTRGGVLHVRATFFAVPGAVRYVLHVSRANVTHSYACHLAHGAIVCRGPVGPIDPAPSSPPRRMAVIGFDAQNAVVFLEPPPAIVPAAAPA